MPDLSFVVAWAAQWELGPGMLVYFTAAFLVGGLVKGTLGVGLPMVAVPLLALVVPAPTAIALMAVPVLASNLWQAIDSGAAKAHVLRFIPLAIALMVATLITVPLALRLSSQMLNILVAAALLTAVFLMAFRPQLHISPRQEKWAGVIIGALAGVMGGVSSMTGPILITYLMALNLKREVFIGSISVIYLFGVVPLYASLIVYGRLGLTEALLSLVGLIPMFAGMVLGKAIRHRLSEVAFQRVLLLFLTLVAVLLMFK